MRNRHWLYLWLVLLAGCASFGLATPQTFDQKLAFAYGTHSAVQQGATQALADKTLSSTDAMQVLKLADESRALLDAARAAAKAGDPTTANGKLLLATSILTQLQTYLRSKQ